MKRKMDEDDNSKHNELQNEKDKMLEDEKEDVEETTSRNTYKWYNINVEFLPAKFGYFFDTAKRMSYLPNMILFLTSLGLSNSESGIILGFR